jgi:uncharacterized membrane protein
MFQPMPSAFGAFRRLALTVFWPCLLFVVVGLLLVLPSAPVTLTPYALIPPVVAVLGVVLVLKVLDPRKAPTKRPDKAAVVLMARSMFFTRLLTGEVAIVAGLIVGMAIYDQTPLLAGLVTAVLLYTWWLRTDNFVGALHLALDPVGAGQLTGAVIKR